MCLAATWAFEKVPYTLSLMSNRNKVGLKFFIHPYFGKPILVGCHFLGHIRKDKTTSENGV